jgi:hypothetical protein
MIDRRQYAPSSASVAEFGRLMSGHVDALERHLSINRWSLAAAVVVLMAYPITQIAISAVPHGIVPDVVRNVLNFL